MRGKWGSVVYDRRKLFPADGMYRRPGSLEKQIDDWENWARATLRTAGLPDTLHWYYEHRSNRVRVDDVPEGLSGFYPGIWGRSKHFKLDRQWFTGKALIDADPVMKKSPALDAWETLVACWRLREALQKANARDAAFYALVMARFGTLGVFAQNVEAEALQGAVVKWGQNKGRREIAEPRRATWLRYAEDLRRRRPKLTLKGEARLVARHFEANQETVRKALRDLRKAGNPLPPPRACP